MSQTIKDQNEYYVLSTPRLAPLVFCQDGYYRVACVATCRKCGGHFTQMLRCHRYRSELGTILPGKAPDPSNERIVTSLMLAACNHGIGNRNFNNQNVRWQAQGSTGWMKLLITDRHHTAMCPVGQMKRVGGFTLGDMDSQILTKGRA